MTPELSSDQSRRDERTRLLIFARYPRPGSVKTRLVPPLTYESAASLYQAFLLDSLEMYGTLPSDVDLALYLSEQEDIEPMRELMQRELNVGSDVSRFTLHAQKGNSLGVRLHSAFTETFEEGWGAACAIGTDHPSLPMEYLHRGLSELSTHDLVIGPADDGGYYLIALRESREEIFLDMPYSTSRLMEETLLAAERHGVSTSLLPPWYDVDDRDSLERLWLDRDLLREEGRVLRLLQESVVSIGLREEH